MKRFVTTILLTVLVGLFVVGVWMPSELKAAGFIRRLAADFDFWGSFEETLTTDDALSTGDPKTSGITIYSKTVFVPPPANVLYLTMSTTGDGHLNKDGLQPATCFTALIDGAFFNPGGQGAAKCATDPATGGTINVPGWIALLKPTGPVGPGEGCGPSGAGDGGGGGGDCHDNSIHYEWCTPIQAGPHTVEVRMASSNGGTVFIEQAHFYVDSSNVTTRPGFKLNNCVDPTPDTEGAAPIRRAQ